MGGRRGVCWAEGGYIWKRGEYGGFFGGFEVWFDGFGAILWVGVGVYGAEFECCGGRLIMEEKKKGWRKL